LLAGRLVERRPDLRGIGITQAGFTFLLQEPNAQVWTLLLIWLEVMDVSAAAAKHPSNALDPVDMLAFLFMLAIMELGKAYDTTALSEQRKNMLPFLVDFGLVYVPQHKPQQYYPTRLATTLTNSISSLRSISAGVSAATADAAGNSLTDQQSKGGIIIETNFRIYAYTSSPLQIAVLSLFSQLKMRFPDMVTGRVSRQSVRRAISYGITAEQIISYLQAHAHEQMHIHAAAANKPVLPPTVVDQIRLWQLENERMKTTGGFLFRDFEDRKEYLDTARFSEEIGVLVWRSDKSGMFFANKHEQIRDYLRSRKKAEQ
jgi:transcription initiation factor TFIIH subunit 4